MLNETCWCITQLTGRTTKADTVKKKLQEHFPGGAEEHIAVEWWHPFRQGNTNFGRTKQWGQREPSFWKTRLNTHRWKHINKTLGKTRLGRGCSWHWFHLYQPMNRNHKALPVHRGLHQLLLKLNSATTVRAVQACRPNASCPSFPITHLYSVALE